jgi:monoamine oxidase
MFYDFIIVGGGISGLYLAYKIHLLYPYKKIVLIEKERSLGGRVYTYYDSKMTVEMGAGRFSLHHIHLISLIMELGFYGKMVNIGSNVSAYVDANGSGIMENSGLYVKGSGIVQRVIDAGKKEKMEVLIKQSFIQFASSILNKAEVQYIKDSFGYYSELVMMNAFDAIRLLDEFHPSNDFYSLRGGLSQIIREMERRIGMGRRRGTRKNTNSKASVRIMRHTKVMDIVPLFGEMGGSGFEVVLQGKMTRSRGVAVAVGTGVDVGTEVIRGKTCICALPKQAIAHMGIFANTKTNVPRLLKGIECGSLCRIYSIFDKGSNGKVWFHDYSKFTTNNELRMVIPIDVDAGILMTSYSDNKYADYWNDLYKEKGVREVNKRLQELMKNSLGIDIPIPKHTRVFYWKCGVGYWGIGANSEMISKQIQKPFDSMNLFICGEHYSATHQQWMEGALETAHQVLRRIEV